MNNKTVGAIIFAMVMVLTTLLFVLLGSSYVDVAVYWIALVIVLSMEFAGGMLFLFAQGQPRRVAAAIGVLLCAVVTVAVSVVCILLFSKGTAFYAAFAAVVVAIAGGQTLILWKHDPAAARCTEQEESKAFFKSCRDVVAVLRTMPEGRKHADALRRLEDDLRYLDDTRRTEQDGQIKDMLNTLSNGLQTPGYDPTAILADLKDLIRQRQYLLHH